MIKPMFWACIVTAFTVLAFTVKVGATPAYTPVDKEALRKGKFVFTPILEASWQHDDNYYLERDQEVSVNTFILKPGFEFGYTTAKTDIALDYFLNAYEFTGDQRVDDDRFLGHDLTLMAHTQTTDHLLIGLDENFVKATITGNLDDLGEEVNKERYEMNYLSPFIAYTFNEIWSLKLRYSNQILAYTEKYNEDADGHRGKLDLEYHLTPTFTFILGYLISDQDYSKSTSSYLSQELDVAFQKEYELFFIKAEAGYHEREFDDDTKGDLDAFVWKFSIYGKTARVKYDISLARNLNTFGQGHQYYRGTKFIALANYDLSQRIDLEIQGNYQKRKYMTSNRDDDLWALSGKLTYEFSPKLSTSVKYGFERRDSNEIPREYDNHYIMMSAKWVFTSFEN